MSKIIENFLIPLFVVISVLYAFNSFGNDTIQLNKIYHHTSDNPVHLEKANISLYFSGDPQVQEYNGRCNAQSCQFFFPKAVINQGECESMVQRLRDYNGSYGVIIQEVTKPTRGLLLVFNFDPGKVALSYESFDSIGLQKGIVFRLYNKELINKLEQTHNKPVLRMLMNSNNAPRIAIDSGHGGADCGARGCNGIQEKDVCLAIGTAVGDLLEQHGCSVVQTRNSDYAVGLDERTSYANNNNVDLFVSIHANYAANQKAIGIETFCLKPSLLKKSYSQLLTHQFQNVNVVINKRAYLSNVLAQSVQRHVCDSVSKFHDESIDRKVKHSVSQVLLGTQSPSVLIEVGFVSNPKEAGLLCNSEYQKSIVCGICDGILSAIRSQSFF